MGRRAGRVANKRMQGLQSVLALHLDHLDVTHTTFRFEWFYPHDLQDRFAAVGLQVTSTYEQMPYEKRHETWALPSPSLDDVAVHLSTNDFAALGAYRMRRGGLRTGWSRWVQDEHFHEYRHVVSGTFPITPEVTALLQSLPVPVRELLEDGRYEPPSYLMFAPMLELLAPTFAQDPRWQLSMHHYFATLHSPPLHGQFLTDAHEQIRTIPDGEFAWKRTRGVLNTRTWWVPPALETIGRSILSFTHEHPAHDPWLFANARLREEPGWVCIGAVTTAHEFSVSVTTNADPQRFPSLYPVLHVKY